MKRFTIILLALLLLTSISGCNKKSPVTFNVLSDIHYTGTRFAYTGTFKEAADTSGSGKQVEYLEFILDGYIDQLADSNAKYVLVTGDLAYNGAKSSHVDLAGKFAEMEKQGAEVLVLPGNHDIVAVAYCAPEGAPVQDEVLTPETWKEVYSDFGYNQAISQDSVSLSYCYDTKEGTRFIMLDSNMMYGMALGKVQPETIKWIEEQLKACKKAGDVAVVACHYNLFIHNPKFVMGYQIGNNNELEDLLSKYDVTLFLSGHLHPQHIENDDRMAEVASGSFAVWPHYYGEVTIDSKGWNYQANAVDVEAYAKKVGSTDPNLTNYNVFGYQFNKDNYYYQAINRMKDSEMSEEEREIFLNYLADLNVYYFAGILDQLDITGQEIYQKYGKDSSWFNYIESFRKDGQQTQLHISYSKDQGFNR